MKRMAWAAAVVAAAMGLASASVAETLEETIDSYQQRDYARASEFFLPLAHQGNAAAQESLGAMYASGRGVPQDYVRAYLWVSRALVQAEGEVAERRRQMLDALEAKMTPSEIAQARNLMCAPRKLQV